LGTENQGLWPSCHSVPGRAPGDLQVKKEVSGGPGQHASSNLLGMSLQ
jgi:hypothetical protein